MIGRGLRCWLLMYEKSLPLDLNACNKCHYSRFFPHSLSRSHFFFFFFVDVADAQVVAG